MLNAESVPEERGVPAREDAEPAAWRKKLETCLKRLDTPYIDFILFHGLGWSDFDTFIGKPGSTLAEARKAQAEGKVDDIDSLQKQLASEVRRLQEECEAAKEKLRAGFGK